MPVRTRTLTLLVASALTLVSCGGSEAPVRERTGEFTVTLDDYLIRPQEVRVPKGQRLTLTVVNRGRLAHALRIRGATKNVLAFTAIRPGESKTRQFSPAPGIYTMYCALANHEELGMYGTLTVG